LVRAIVRARQEARLLRRWARARQHAARRLLRILKAEMGKTSSRVKPADTGGDDGEQAK
jgi:hypothetical protein